MTSLSPYTAGIEGDVTAEVERRVVEINKAFAGWIMASWEMCPTHVWRGAAQEYCNKIDKLMKEYSISEPGGTDMHVSTASTRAWESPGGVSNQPRSPPFATTSVGAATAKPNNSSPPGTAAPSHPTKFGTTPIQSQATPTAFGFNSMGGTTSPTVPGPIPSESPNKGGSSQQQPAAYKPMVSAAATAAASGKSSRKRRATEDPEGAPNPHNPPKPPLFSSMLTSQQTQPASSAPATAPAFSFNPDGAKAPAAAKAADKSKAHDGASGADTAPAPIPKPPLFGSLFNSNSSAASGAASAAPAGPGAAPVADTSSKPFAALFGNSSTGAALGSQPTFGSSAPAAAVSSPSATGGPSSFGGLFGSTAGKTDSSVTASFTFGGGTSTPVFGAGSGFGANVMASVSTPTFGTLGAAPDAAAVPADDDGAEKEPTQKVELKGDEKTDIQFSGKTSFRFMVDGKWTDGTVGALTVRKDKASGKYWLQVNNESKGNILLYAAFIPTASATVTEAKSTVMVALNVFKYPPGKEPHKTVDDGAGGRKDLPEKEENTISAKNAMFKVKPDNLTPLVDALTTVGMKCTKK